MRFMKKKANKSGKTSKNRAADRKQNSRQYSMGLKTGIACLQALCVAIITVCTLTVGYWTDNTYNLEELGRPFEETSIFLNDVERIVRAKINCTRNEALFETDGEEDLSKKIDIRQYVAGVSDTANQNENTTYLLSDLINFYPNTGALEEIVGKLDNSENPSDASYDNLASLASGMEKILPVSGSTLADTAKLSGSPYTKLSEYYSDLCQTSADLYRRYQSYTAEHSDPKGEAHQKAPGNIRYFAENTTTKAYYTNLDARSCSEAKSLIAKSDDLKFLFEGVRTMNIMVADTEHSLNKTVTSKFIDTVFLGSNERIVIAYEPGYPVGDTLHQDYLAYQSRRPVAVGAVVLGILSALCLLALLVLGGMVTGRRDSETLEQEGWFDRIPTEIAAGMLLGMVMIWYWVMQRLKGTMFFPGDHLKGWYVVLAVTEYLLGVSGLYSIIRRRRHQTFATNSVIYTVVRVSQQVINARVTSGKLLMVYSLFIAANFLFLRAFGTIGIIMVLVLDMGLILYLMRDQVGKLSVRQGLREISKGRLDYKIDTHGLTGDSLEMARAVNEMGDGLQEAVNSIVKNERLKAELITNVSHDLKTPLTSVINYVDLLKRLDLKDERAKEYIDVLDHKSQRLKSLISDLIDASKISSGNIELDMQPLDLRSMLMMAEGEFEERFEDAKLTVRMALPESAEMISADGSQLYRVLDNLFSNTAKYAKEGTEVRLTMTQEDGYVQVLLSNTSRDYLEKSGDELLERFVRGDQARSSSEGSGLGLSIAKNLTELMGGQFSVEAGGYTFETSLRFPVLSEPGS